MSAVQLPGLQRLLMRSWARSAKQLRTTTARPLSPPFGVPPARAQILFILFIIRWFLKREHYRGRATSSLLAQPPCLFRLNRKLSPEARCSGSTQLQLLDRVPCLQWSSYQSVLAFPAGPAGYHCPIQSDIEVAIQTVQSVHNSVVLLGKGHPTRAKHRHGRLQGMHILHSSCLCHCCSFLAPAPFSLHLLRPKPGRATLSRCCCGLP